jgi:hypothetical protein
MRVMCILTVWNEREYLPLKLEYCKQNKLEPYIIDNMSTDGSWEYLQENNIPSHRLDTGESFDLRMLQNDIVETIHREKPDWAIYNGCDLFPVTIEPLHDALARLDRRGFNLAQIECVNFFNTGEERGKKDPFNTYFHYGTLNKFNMIHKYNPVLRYLADDVSFPGQRLGIIEGMMINYGNTKTKEEREGTLKRRRKAWENGEPPGHGSHYLEGERNNWIWPKEDLTDVRETKYWKYVEKLQEVSKAVYGE